MKERSTTALVTFLFAIAFLSSAEATAESYTTNFPSIENPISESGRWVGGKTIGLAWADFQSTPGLAFGKQLGTSPSKYDDSIGLLTGSWGLNQTVQATVKTVNQNDGIFEELEIRLRSTVTTNNSTGYECLFSARSSPNAYVQIVRWNGPFGNWTPVADQAWRSTTATRSNARRAAAPLPPISTERRSSRSRIARTPAATLESERFCKIQRA